MSYIHYAFTILLTGCLTSGNEFDTNRVCEQGSINPKMENCIYKNDSCSIHIENEEYIIENGKLISIKKKITEKDTLNGVNLNKMGLSDLYYKLNKINVMSGKSLEYFEEEKQFDIEEYLQLSNYVICDNGDHYSVFIYDGFNGSRYISVSSVPFF